MAFLRRIRGDFNTTRNLRMKKLEFGILTSLVILLLFLAAGCTEDRVDNSAKLDYRLSEAISKYAPGDGGADFYVLPDERNLEDIPQDPKNRLTQAKVQLGKFLFFETGFAMDSEHNSSRQTYSCASCHIPEKGFRPDNVQGIADGGMGFGDHREMNPDYNEDELDVQEARPLNLINVAFVKNTAWNGQFGSTGANIGTEHVWNERTDTGRNSWGFEGLETQNFQGMKTHRFKVNKALIEKYGYLKLFDESFPEYDPANRYSLNIASLAISAYLRTVISNRAPFQDWLKGDSHAMTQDEKEGALLFFGKANCNRCHYNQNLGSGEFHALGVNDMDQHPQSVKADNPLARRNLGRAGFTLDKDDLYQFKVPGLYNICDSDFFFHGSSATTIRDVIDYKDKAVAENERVSDSQMSAKFIPLGLTDIEKEQLRLFLENSLRDPDMTRYQPQTILSGMCFPNNDPISQAYLDCQ